MPIKKKSQDKIFIAFIKLALEQVIKLPSLKLPLK